MVTFNRLSTMMYSRITLSSIILTFVLLLLGCSKEETKETVCSINGTIDHRNPSGVVVTLQNVSDPSVKHIAVSDTKGVFEFHDIMEGTYSIDATKDGYKWIWMVDDGVVNHRNRFIELKGGQSKELAIYMSGGSSITDFQLDLTDISGNPIGNSVSISKTITTISFRLFNGTGNNQAWSVGHTDQCFVTDGRDMEYVFSSFSPTSGTLKPGDNVVVIGTINNKIFNIKPWQSYTEITFYSGADNKSISIDIDFN